MGQMLRHAGRAVAAYFSDLLLWISVAGMIEILAVVGMAVLCIASAGFLFEGMKRSPVVLVLGGLVALTGTFLVFREIRSFIWPPLPAVAAPPAVTPGPGPIHDGLPPLGRPLDLPKAADTAPCGTRMTKLSCEAGSECVWRQPAGVCTNHQSETPSQRRPPDLFEATACVGLDRHKCLVAAMVGCYWSALFDRCEHLQVGTGLARPDFKIPSLLKPDTDVKKLPLGPDATKGDAGLEKTAPAAGAPNCLILDREQCASRKDCRWYKALCWPSVALPP